MAKHLVLKGDTSRIEYIFIQNSSLTTGAGLTGLAFNSASLTAYYVRTQGSATAITLATQTVTGAFSSGGFVEVDATNMPGVYRLDIPDACFATGVDKVVIMLKGATNMAPVTLEYQLVNFNPEDGVRMGMTALPNAAADAAGGLPISDAGGLDMDSIKTDTAAILVDTGTTLQAELDGIQADTEDIQSRLPAALVGGRMDSSVGAVAANAITAAAIADGAIDAATFAAGAIDAAALAADAGAEIADAVWDEVITGANHNVQNSAAKYLREASEAVALATGNAQAGAAGSITLAAGASATDNLYNGERIEIIEGTGAGQSRLITAYNGTTKVASVDRNWTTNPDTTSVYAITGADADIRSIGGSDTAADNLLSDYDGTGYNKSNSTIGTATVAGSVTGNVGGNVAGSVGSVTGAVGSVTGNVGGNVTGSVGSLATQAKADVNAEVLDVMATDTFAEPSAVPAATASLKDMLHYLFSWRRNRKTQTATTMTLRNDANTGNIATSAVSDDGTTLEIAEDA